MSTITRVSVHSYTYTLDNFATPMRYQKGAKLDLTKFVAVVETDDGLRGEYAPHYMACLLYTSPSPRDATLSRMPSSA